MHSLISELQAAGQDFEFYPTTREIIAVLIRDLNVSRYSGRTHRHNTDSILDIGAGNGKVLAAIQANEELHFNNFYAIEKSDRLRNELPADVMVIGTDFKEQSLFSKEIDVIFCNPPYSEYVDWTVKIIRESAARLVYLVIPERWENDSRIADAVKFREAKTHRVGSFDFLQSEDRAARAKVHLIRVELACEKEDAFERLFAEQFKSVVDKFSDKDQGQPAEAERKHAFSGLVVGENYPEAMVTLYLAEIAKINRNYQLVGELDADLLREFDIVPAKIMACLKARLSGLRLAYWQELFTKMAPITNRLTSKTRNRLLEQLNKHTAVDFTVSNIYAVIVWALKNANAYIDSQLLDTYELMVDKCNVKLYKSNHKQFVCSHWCYSRANEDSRDFALKNRIVMHRCGGLTPAHSSWQREQYNGLDQRAYEFIGDLLTVANNLGFNVSNKDPLEWRGPKWETNQSQEFYWMNKGNAEVLFEAKAFKNGNLHLKIASRFMLALNVEHGRLRGWLRSKEEAAQELEPAAAECFKVNYTFITNGNSFPLLQS